MGIRGQCLICKEMFTSNNLTALPCGHIFHADCIQKLFERTFAACPDCKILTHTSRAIRRLFFNACDDQNVDEVTLKEKKLALSRAEAEIRELKKDKKELEDKLALELGKVASLGVQVYIRNRQLNEATNLQKELIGVLCKEREKLKLFREKESDFELRIRNLEEQLRISKKNENDSELHIQNLEEQHRILEKNENGSKPELRIKYLEEQMRISWKSENDAKLRINFLEELLRISKKNENDSKLRNKYLEEREKDAELRIKNLEEQLEISKENENDSKLCIKKLEEQLEISKKTWNNIKLHSKNLEEQLEISKKNENDLKLHIKNLEEQLEILKKNENNSKLHIQNLEEQLRISEENENHSELHIQNLEEQLRISKNEIGSELLIKNEVEKVDRMVIGKSPTKAQRVQGHIQSTSAALPQPRPPQLSQQCENQAPSLQMSPNMVIGRPPPTEAQRAIQSHIQSTSAALPPPTPPQLSQQCEDQALSHQMSPKNCIFCGERHWPTDCMIYPTLMVRSKRIANLKRCERCLGPGTHMATSCRTKSICFFCKKAKRLTEMTRHHSAFCHYQFNM